MKLSKIISTILALFAVVVAVYLYLTREEACADDQPWWLVIVLVVLNSVFLIYSVFSGRDKENQPAKDSE